MSDERREPDEFDIKPIDPSRPTDADGHPVPTLYEVLFAPTITPFGVAQLLAGMALFVKAPSVLVGFAFVLAFYLATDYLLAKPHKDKWLVHYRDRLMSVSSEVVLDAYLDGVKTGKQVAEALAETRDALSDDAKNREDAL